MKAPSKRREMSPSSQMEHVLRNLRSVSVQCDLSPPEADLVVEPDVLICPITRNMFRDPVVVVDSGHTYERSAVVSHFQCNGTKDPLTGLALRSARVMTIWTVRQIVQDWLDKHPDVTPDGWDSRELLEPSKDDGTHMVENDDAGVLRTWRAMCPELQEEWPEDEQLQDWAGVTMENGRVVQLDLEDVGPTREVPAEIGRLTSLESLDLSGNLLISVPAEIGQLASLEMLSLWDNKLTRVPAEIGRLTSLESLDLNDNQLTSVPAEIGQLTSLEELYLHDNQLTSVPAEIWQLTSLTELHLHSNRLTSVPAEIGQLTSLEGLWLNDNKLTTVPAEIGQLTSLKVLYLNVNQLTTVPAEIGQLTSLEELYLSGNRLTSVPAEIGQLTSLKGLGLGRNQLTSVPAAIRELRAARCRVDLDVGVTVDDL